MSRWWGRDDGPYHSANALTRYARYAHVAIGTIRAMATSDVIVTRSHFAHLPCARWRVSGGSPWSIS